MGLKDTSAIDTLGFPFFTHCTRANVSDDAGLIEMLTLIKGFSLCLTAHYDARDFHAKRAAPAIPA
jgi:hypothetical protein